MPGSDLVQSLSRGCQILELVAASEDGLTVQQLADRLGLKPTTVHGLARTLVVHGVLERATHPIRFRLGHKMINLVDQYRNRPLMQRASRALSQLHTEFPDGRFTLAQPMGSDIVLTLRIGPERPGVLEQPGYSVMPAYTSACGLVFQAFWQHEQRHLNRRRYPFDEYGAHAWETEERLDVFLDQARKQGYAAAPVGDSGLYRFAVPIFSPTHDLFGALGTAIPLGGRLSFESIMQLVVPRLKTAAEEIVRGPITTRT